jgi:ankyrin repeat protein
MIHACVTGDLEMVKILVKNEYIIQRSQISLIWEIIDDYLDTSKDINFVKFLVKVGIDIQADDNPLIFAVINGHLDIVKLLFEPINYLLFIAIIYNRINICKFLIDSGIFPTRNALTLAKIFYHEEISEYLEPLELYDRQRKDLYNHSEYTRLPEEL